MLNLIVRLFEPLLRLLIPPVGRHRHREATPNAVPLVRRRLLVCRSAVSLASLPSLAACNETFVKSLEQAAYERWERAELRLRRERRRALWLAVHGVDVGPRVIHGVAVVR